MFSNWRLLGPPMSALAPTPVANPRIQALPLIAINQTLAFPMEVEHWSLTTLREKLVKIGAKVVRHGRYWPREAPE